MRKLTTILLLALAFLSQGQSLTQTVKGTILDQDTRQGIPFASLILSNADTILRTESDVDGLYTIPNVPIGRYTLRASFFGFTPSEVEVMVTSAKASVADISLSEDMQELDEVNISVKVDRHDAQNNMATTSAKTLFVEEANRYAGAFDDPARLVSSFAGITGAGTAENAISIRGNNPKSVLWRVEGVEVFNPNHFADLNSFGGGGISALSSHVLANSDFFSGAFPAEYTNSMSGVFDIKMRKGNWEDHEHTFKFGLIGVDFASEGPLSREKKSSYVFNYRYSTLGLVTMFLPAEARGTNYQDLSFKLNFPSEKYGTVSVWGLGLLDKTGSTPDKDSTEWFYNYEREDQKGKQFMGAIGASHLIYLNDSTFLSTTLSSSATGLDWKSDLMNYDFSLNPQNKVLANNSNFILSSYMNKRFNKSHTNKTGVIVKGLGYDLNYQYALDGQNLSTISDEKGGSALVTAYSSSHVELGKWVVNAGLSAQHFFLTGKSTLEPRLGLTYVANKSNSVGFAYGRHSQVEQLQYYFTQDVNRELDFAKAHHFVLRYKKVLSDKLSLNVEPYFQYLYDVPVSMDNSLSFVNLRNDWFVQDSLKNEGVGRNYGIDINIDKAFKNGFYWMVSTSLFRSEYKTPENPWRNSRYDRRYVVNGLIGKEWELGKEKNKALSVNLKMTYQGGDPYTAADEAASIASQTIITDDSNPFGSRVNDAFITHFTVNYRINKPNRTVHWGLNVLNATMYKEFYSQEYNLQTGEIDNDLEAIMIPNLSYRVDF